MLLEFCATCLSVSRNPLFLLQVFQTVVLCLWQRNPYLFGFAGANDLYIAGGDQSGLQLYKYDPRRDAYEQLLGLDVGRSE